MVKVVFFSYATLYEDNNPTRRRARNEEEKRSAKQQLCLSRFLSSRSLQSEVVDNKMFYLLGKLLFPETTRQTSDEKTWNVTHMTTTTDNNFVDAAKHVPTDIL